MSDNIPIRWALNLMRMSDSRQGPRQQSIVERGPNRGLSRGVEDYPQLGRGAGHPHHAVHWHMVTWRDLGVGLAQHDQVHHTLQLLSESPPICPFSSGMSDSFGTCAWPVVWKLLTVVQSLNERE